MQKFIDPKAPWSTQLRQHIQAEDIAPLNSNLACEECGEITDEERNVYDRETETCFRLCPGCMVDYEVAGAVFS